MKKSTALPALTRRSVLSIAAATALLQACGGGGGGGGGNAADPGTPVSPADPATPLTSADAGTPPTVATQPADASVPAGTPVTFSVVAAGAPPLAYQWLRDGAPVAGATDAAYALAFPTRADSGARFSVVVSNAAGSVTSNTATLTVTAARGVALLAGGVGAPGSIDGTGTSARFDAPYSTAVDASGNVYVADYNNHTIRKITPAGAVSTFAGTPGNGGHADGTGAAAQFWNPRGVCCDAAGNVYVTERWGMVVRKITPAGVVTTLAGQYGVQGYDDGAGAAASFNQPSGIAADAAGNLYVADEQGQTIRRITAAGVVTTLAGSGGQVGSTDATGSAARFYRPQGIAIDHATGDLYVADTASNRLRRITPAGVVTTLAGSGNPGSTDAVGTAADFNQPQQLVVVGATLFVSDVGNHVVRAVALADGTVTTFAGRSTEARNQDGTGTAARFQTPQGMAADPAGNLYVCDYESCLVRKITPARVVTTLAGAYFQQGSTDATGAAARFSGASAAARDAAGNLYVCDNSNNTIRKITAAGVVSTVAGTAGFWGTADGTGAAARFDSPNGIVVDAAGTLYVADGSNRTIRKITPAGVVTTLCGGYGFQDGTGSAGRFNSPAHMALDPAGNIVVADSMNNAIRRVTPAGAVTTIAGNGTPAFLDGTGTAAEFYTPGAVAVDAAGVIYVADSNNHVIRRIGTDGVVTTLAGTPGAKGSTDGTGAAARFDYPTGICLDGTGNLYVADTENATIRKVTPAGVVTTVCGQAGRTGVQGGTPGGLSRPRDVIASADGKQLWVVDSMESCAVTVNLA